MKTLIETRAKATVAILFLGLTTAPFATAADFHVPTTNYPTIQAAVNAAQTNDTIHIASGVYTGQVQIISQKLTLIGQPGTILRATQTMTNIPTGAGGGPGHIPIMFVYLSEITVRGLTFEGERLAGHFVGNGDMIGLYFLRSSGNVESCAFYGFRENTPGAEGAGSVWFLCHGSDDIDARVVGCTFSDNYEGIFLRAEGTIRQNITATLENNTIIGLGPVATDYNYSGIAVDGGVGGRIAGNTISGFSYVGTAADFDISFGILASYQPAPFEFGVIHPLEIEGNTLRDNQIHVSLGKANGSVIRNNRFQGTGAGILPIGLVVSGTNVTIANNQFEDMPEGIRLLGNDPIPGFGLGDILGFAINAQVTSNRFCNVTTPINQQPPATTTQQGTLLCPFPSPPLSITPAVLVSWPGEEDGWSVESAPAFDGPWTPLIATPFLQGGRHSVAVPTDAERGFFRLKQ